MSLFGTSLRGAMKRAKEKERAREQREALQFKQQLSLREAMMQERARRERIDLERERVDIAKAGAKRSDKYLALAEDEAALKQSKLITEQREKAINKKVIADTALKFEKLATSFGRADLALSAKMLQRAPSMKGLYNLEKSLEKEVEFRREKGEKAKEQFNTTLEKQRQDAEDKLFKYRAFDALKRGDRNKIHQLMKENSTLFGKVQTVYNGGIETQLKERKLAGEAAQAKEPHTVYERELNKSLMRSGPDFEIFKTQTAEALSRAKQFMKAGKKKEAEGALEKARQAQSDAFYNAHSALFFLKETIRALPADASDERIFQKITKTISEPLLNRVVNTPLDKGVVQKKVDTGWLDLSLDVPEVALFSDEEKMQREKRRQQIIESLIETAKRKSENPTLMERRLRDFFRQAEGIPLPFEEAPAQGAEQEPSEGGMLGDLYNTINVKGKEGLTYLGKMYGEGVDEAAKVARYIGKGITQSPLYTMVEEINSPEKMTRAEQEIMEKGRLEDAQYLGDLFTLTVLKALPSGTMTENPALQESIKRAQDDKFLKYGTDAAGLALFVAGPLNFLGAVGGTAGKILGATSDKAQWLMRTAGIVSGLSTAQTATIARKQAQLPEGEQLDLKTEFTKSAATNAAFFAALGGLRAGAHALGAKLTKRYANALLDRFGAKAPDVAATLTQGATNVIEAAAIGGLQTAQMEQPTLEDGIYSTLSMLAAVSLFNIVQGNDARLTNRMNKIFRDTVSEQAYEMGLVKRGTKIPSIKETIETLNRETNLNIDVGRVAKGAKEASKVPLSIEQIRTFIMEKDARGVFVASGTEPSKAPPKKPPVPPKRVKGPGKALIPLPHEFKGATVSERISPEMRAKLRAMARPDTSRFLKKVRVTFKGSEADMQRAMEGVKAFSEDPSFGPEYTEKNLKDIIASSVKNDTIENAVAERVTLDAFKIFKEVGGKRNRRPGLVGIKLKKSDRGTFRGGMGEEDPALVRLGKFVRASAENISKVFAKIKEYTIDPMSRAGRRLLKFISSIVSTITRDGKVEADIMTRRFNDEVARLASSVEDVNTGMADYVRSRALTIGDNYTMEVMRIMSPDTSIKATNTYLNKLGKVFPNLFDVGTQNRVSKALVSTHRRRPGIQNRILMQNIKVGGVKTNLPIGSGNPILGNDPEVQKQIQRSIARVESFIADKKTSDIKKNFKELREKIQAVQQKGEWEVTPEEGQKALDNLQPADLPLFDFLSNKLYAETAGVDPALKLFNREVVADAMNIGSSYKNRGLEFAKKASDNYKKMVRARENKRPKQAEYFEAQANFYDYISNLFLKHGKPLEGYLSRAKGPFPADLAEYDRMIRGDMPKTRKVPIEKVGTKRVRTGKAEEVGLIDALKNMDYMRRNYELQRMRTDLVKKFTLPDDLMLDVASRGNKKFKHTLKTAIKEIKDFGQVRSLEHPDTGNEIIISPTGEITFDGSTKVPIEAGGYKGWALDKDTSWLFPTRTKEKSMLDPDGVLAPIGTFLRQVAEPAVQSIQSVWLSNYKSVAQDLHSILMFYYPTQMIRQQVAFMQQMGIKGIPIGAKEMVKAHFGALKPYFNDLIGKMPWLKKFKNTDLAPYDHLMDKIDKSYETFKDVGQPEDAILRRGTTALYGTAASIRDFSTDKYFKKTFGLMTYGRNKEVSWQKLKGQDIFKNKKQHDTAYDKAWLDKIFSPQNYKDFSKGSKVYATIIPSIEKGWRDYQNDLIRIHSDFVSYEKPIQTKFIQGLRESPSGRWVTNLITWKNAQIANTRRAFHELFDPRPEAKVNGLITLTRTLTAGALMGALLWDDLNKRRYKQRKPFEFSQYSLDPSAAFLPRFSKMMHDFAKTYKEDPAKATKNLTVDAGDIAGNFVIGASGALVMTVTALQDPVLLVSRVASMMGYTKRGRKKKGTMKQRGFKSKGGF